MHAMVDAVPMVMQWPLERDMQPSASRSCSAVIRPAFRSFSSFQTWVPEPRS